MTERGPTPADQTAKLLAIILSYLREHVPGLSKVTDRAFVIEFSCPIRHGQLGVIDRDTWDDSLEPVHCANMGQPEKQYHLIESFLSKNLPRRFHSSYHGKVILTTVIKDGALGFGFRVKEQIALEWSERATKPRWNGEARQRT